MIYGTGRYPWTKEESHFMWRYGKYISWTQWGTIDNYEFDDCVEKLENDLAEIKEEIVKHLDTLSMSKECLDDLREWLDDTELFIYHFTSEGLFQFKKPDCIDSYRRILDLFEVGEA